MWYHLQIKRSERYSMMVRTALVWRAHALHATLIPSELPHKVMKVTLHERGLVETYFSTHSYMPQLD
jgi:hypothetical protein